MYQNETEDVDGGMMASDTGSSASMACSSERTTEQHNARERQCCYPPSPPKQCQGFGVVPLFQLPHINLVGNHLVIVAIVIPDSLGVGRLRHVFAAGLQHLQLVEFLLRECHGSEGSHPQQRLQL